MSAASNYTEKNILNAMLRGVAYPLPTQTYVSLHTGSPSEDGSTNEVSTGTWPGYVRRQAEQGSAIGTGWVAPAAGDTSVSTNAKQITYPVQDGVVDVTVTHMAVWDAASGGNMLTYAILDAARTLSPLDVLVFDIGQLSVAAA